MRRFKRGEIPAKIKPKFVDDLIESGKCVCGQPLDEQAKEHLLTWRGRPGSSSTKRRSTPFGTRHPPAERRERVRTDCASLRTEWAKTKESIQKTVEEISAIDSDLEGKDFKIDEIRALQLAVTESQRRSDSHAPLT